MIREEAGLKAVTQTFHYQTKRERRAQNGCEKRGPDNSETKRNSRGGEKARDGLVGKQRRVTLAQWVPSAPTLSLTHTHSHTRTLSLSRSATTALYHWMGIVRPEHPQSHVSKHTRALVSLEQP
ncbi:hypothetical protein DPX16_13781 [Anabarilius grahami]|uniref:Uncharacterized protein n=1 Tax=Anabarilius grahami TaxID=495550 RepID=A0A3N0XSS9_ANAGA|nr:hypothetical protein DPX16_13781 [Anabarilius grahami]